MKTFLSFLFLVPLFTTTQSVDAKECFESNASFYKLSGSSSSEENQNRFGEGIQSIDNSISSGKPFTIAMDHLGSWGTKCNKRDQRCTILICTPDLDQAFPQYRKAFSNIPKNCMVGIVEDTGSSLVGKGTTRLLIATRNSQSNSKLSRGILKVTFQNIKSPCGTTNEARECDFRKWKADSEVKSNFCGVEKAEKTESTVKPTSPTKPSAPIKPPTTPIRPPEENNQAGTQGPLGKRCPIRRMAEPKYLGFNAEGSVNLSEARSCGSEIMQGYDPNSQGAPSTKYKFAYLEAFGGPTGESDNWWDMESGERDRTILRARRCGISIPSESDRWLGVDGMKCILKQVRNLSDAGISAFEIDNAGWLRGKYHDQFQFVKKFTQMMEESGICNISLVMKNLSPREFKRVADSIKKREAGDANEINGRLISNFAVIEEHLSLSESRKSLSGTFVTPLQSPNTRRYAFKGFSKGAKCGRGLD